MNTRYTIITILVIVVIALAGWWGIKRGNNPETATSTPVKEQAAANLPDIGSQATADDIVIDSPAPGDTISSPISVSGKARGNWFFEASAPVAVIDLSGTILGRGTIEAQGNWMTTDFVPFTGTISFQNSSSTANGAAVLFLNDNPSGEASTSKYLAVPVYFKAQ